MTGLEANIVQVLESRDHVSFAELRRIEGFSGGDDPHNIELNENSNIYLWINMSEAAAEIIQQLISSKRFKFEPCSPLVYLTDGCTLSMPIMKKARKQFKKPHWLPVTISKKAS